jgi:hypothetical protein
VSLLEQRYRSVLGLLPASYRAEREEEMVAAYMEMSGEVPDEVNPRPRWGEIASVLALSMRVRLGGAGASPGFVVLGTAVRLVALLGLAYQGMDAARVVAVVARAVMFGTAIPLAGEPGSIDRLLSLLVSMAAVCPAVAFAAILRGHVRPAKIAALLGVAPTLVYFALPMILNGSDGIRPLPESAYVVFAIVPVLALLAGFHSDVSPWRRSWALALAPPVAGAAGIGLTWLAVEVRLPVPEWLSLWLDLGLAIAVWAAVSVAVLVRRSSPSWALALSAAGLLMLLTRLPMLVNLPEGVLWTTACAQCALLGSLTLVLAGAGARALVKARPVPQP